MTDLFRAVDADEVKDLRATGTWNPSPNGAGGKGFFYSQEGAEQFGAQQSAMGGATTVVIKSTAQSKIVRSSYQQSAATEGLAVFILNRDLSKIVPEVTHHDR